MVKKKLIIAVLLLISGAYADDIPAEIKQQHDKYNNQEFMTFTFIGIPEKITTETYLTPHGEMKGLVVAIEKVIIGHYDGSSIEFGIPVKYVTDLVFGEKYYMTAGWDRHGMILFSETKIENNNVKKDTGISSLIN